MGSKDKDSIITVLICLVNLFSMEAKRIPYLGFAITNILKIFNKCKFKNGYLQNILRKKGDFSGGNKTLNQISSTLI